MHNEMKLWMNVENRGFYAMSKMFSSKLLSRETKRKLYISYLRTIAMYGCETWSTTKGNELKLPTFERKVLEYMVPCIMRKQVSMKGEGTQILRYHRYQFLITFYTTFDKRFISNENIR